MNYFKELSLSSDLMRSLEELDYLNLTPIQSATIPLLLSGKNLIAKAATGSGKTAAYSIPIIESVKWIENKPQALIIAPNRELALQISEDITQIGRYKRIKALPIYGRASIKEQVLALKQKNHIVVATPGRLMDLIEKDAISLSELRYLVLDEADELLRVEFMQQLKTMFTNLPKSCHIALFSATMTNQVNEIKQFRNLDFEYVDATSLDTLQIKEFNYKVLEQKKLQALVSIITTHSNHGGIIFTNTKAMAEKVCKKLKQANISAVFLHADLEQRKRIQNMNEFKVGNFLFLVATDISSRGIDVDGIDLVINFDLPTTSANYTHRIGRIGRNGREGLAINLVADEQLIYLKRIERYVNRTFTLDVIDTPSVNSFLLLTSADSSNTPNKKNIKREKKGGRVGTDITKLYINGGKRKKLRAADIVGTLCSIPSITPEDIGIIEIKDNETYVEILNGKSDLALKELKSKTIKNRTYKVHIAR